MCTKYLLQWKVYTRVFNTKLLGLHIVNHLNLKNHMNQATSNLYKACHTVTLMFYHIINTATLKTVILPVFTL